ncbi:hypothetical protein DFH94DRAFT_831793 [Russula ochroleuca]|uniref:Exonuclease domain-containing protein n=1 Tax=Russula ochroleuca TaxID=152965 RepID=A0A9P5JTJ8_9AGAM|nr:hypothetical protein DFH94DRAFT_831793 [Russula ochroleuca]
MYGSRTLDVRDLVLHVIADSPPPSWIRVQNPHSIQKLVVLLVPGITSTVLSLPPLPTSAIENRNVPIAIPLPPDPPPPTPSSPPDLPSSVDPHSEEAAALYGGIPFITRTFSHACPTRAPGDANRLHSVLNTFFQTPVSGEEKRRRLRERVAVERSAKKDPTQYLLTVEQMVENDYPVPSYLSDVFSKPDGWIETPEADPDSKPGYQSVYAIDCEMCITADGKALTRVCVIDYATNKVAYDQFVKPPSPITDYLTRFSGITAQALESVTTTLADVQAHLSTLITPSTILIGHSLESDLRALQLSHPRCIDTALIFHHPRGRPLKPGLAWLTRKWLGRTIQDRGPGGHDPEEDARACVDLLKAKIKNGPGYGEFKTDYEPILARIARSQSHTPSRGAGTGARTAIVDHGNPGAWHGTSADAPATTVPCTNDAEILEGVLGALDSHEFVFARLMGLADALGWVTPKAPADSGTNPENAETSRDNAVPTENAENDANHDAAAADTPPVPPAAAASPDQNQTNNTLFSAVSNLDAQLTALHAALPPRTAFLLFSGHSDPRSMSVLAARRAQYQASQNQKRGAATGTGTGTGNAGTDDGEPVRWSTADDRALEEAVARARMGLLFVGVKSS